MLSVGTYAATRRLVGELCGRYARPRVLDVGCGDGRPLVDLSSAIGEGVGIDVSPDAVEAARRRAAGSAGSAGSATLAFHATPVERLASLEPAPFDLVLFVGSLEHIDDAELALATARRHLRPGGRIVVVAISPRAPHAVVSRWMLERSASPVVAHLGIGGLRRIAPRVGLRLEEARPLERGGVADPGVGRGARAEASSETGSSAGSMVGSGARPRAQASRGARLANRLLALYDRIGGPTHAVILAGVEDVSGDPRPSGDAAAARPGRR